MESNKMIYKQTQRQTPFTIANIIERMVICDFYREQADFSIEELTSLNSALPYDFIMLSGGNSSHTEIKVRTCNINTYPDNWIELAKLMDLYAISYATNKPAKFILSFKDGIVVWDILEIYKRAKKNQLKTENKVYDTYTADSTSDEQKSVPCIMLSRSYATIYFFQRKPDIYLKEKAIEWMENNPDSELFYKSWTNEQLIKT